MQWLAWLVVSAVGGALFLFSRKGEAAEMKVDLDALFVKYGAQYGLDPLLLKAIAKTESSLNPDAVRNNPPHDVSVGLMQILCIPGEDGVCTNRFNIQPWPVQFEDLKNPDLNIRLGAQILAWNIRNYGFPRGLAMYNHWGARNSAPGGPFPNDGYVAKVLKYHAQLTGV